jgi:hypothetical protein
VEESLSGDRGDTAFSVGRAEYSSQLEGLSICGPLSGQSDAQTGSARRQPTPELAGEHVELLSAAEIEAELFGDGASVVPTKAVGCGRPGRVRRRYAESTRPSRDGG